MVRPIDLQDDLSKMPVIDKVDRVKRYSPQLDRKKQAYVIQVTKKEERKEGGFKGEERETDSELNQQTSGTEEEKKGKIIDITV